MLDKIALQVARHKLEGIAEEMGEVLQRTAFSANIKERRDFSCAITNADGKLVAQAAHIPVHLGAIETTLDDFLKKVEPEAGAGYLLNDPYSGGTHLPDISFLLPWTRGQEFLGWVINRAHHTDVGGSRSGSMAVSRNIEEEGYRTGPKIIYRDGSLLREQIDGLLDASRTPDERLTDIEAQIAAAKRGLNRLQKWNRNNSSPPGKIFNNLLDYSQNFSEDLFNSLPEKKVSASDVMDGDGIREEFVEICVSINSESDRLRVDFTNTDDQVEGNINCPRSVVKSATYYVIQCLLGSDVPINGGIYRPVEIITRSGSLLEVEYPGAVAGGNVETSQRVVDVICKALSDLIPEQIPAASQGTMNNITLGCELDDSLRTYYETLGGGTGGGPQIDGLSGRQVHMTNTQNTPIEEFERNFPVEITQLTLRHSSGGEGRNDGGDGLVKGWKALDPVEVSLLTDRRNSSPYGLHGAFPGASGENIVIKDGSIHQLKAKTNLRLKTGDRLIIKTPGGGGWNNPDT